LRVIEKLRAELKAIQKWPAEETFVTETEREAVLIRCCRAIELRQQIAALISRN
jgi:hypothetical protein